MSIRFNTNILPSVPQHNYKIELIDAIKQGRTEVALELLKNLSALDTKITDKDGNSLLQLACQHQLTPVIDQLLILRLDWDYQTCLMQTIDSFQQKESEVFIQMPAEEARRELNEEANKVAPIVLKLLSQSGILLDHFSEKQKLIFLAWSLSFNLNNIDFEKQTELVKKLIDSTQQNFLGKEEKIAPLVIAYLNNPNLPLKLFSEEQKEMFIYWTISFGAPLLDCNKQLELIKNLLESGVSSDTPNQYQLSELIQKAAFFGLNDLFSLIMEKEESEVYMNIFLLLLENLPKENKKLFLSTMNDLVQNQKAFQENAKIAALREYLNKAIQS
ncbi:MAG: hypothetical protein COT84_00635 [Chlamydiae bacterium CG10_big_fil_rev_8_21_14_0_10_35_9]|nr:MAG: hypothetical protein COT84_00635 [Chlamydiae bacterium CG10_big_fil_rev_8_21_14_0_10_35_9]